VIAIGASAGGVEALSAVVRDLPPDLPASVLIVLHLPRGGYSALPNILQRQSQLPVSHAWEGAPLEPATVYVAPPDRHLVVSETRVHLDPGPTENSVRPSVDRLFTSIAHVFGPRGIGVVLSGMLDDGTAGLQAIRRKGGVAVVQDPADAVFPGMPTSAVRFADPQHVVPLMQIGPLLKELVMDVVPDGPRERDPADPRRPDNASGLTCPECGGALWEEERGESLGYRCRIGHGFSVESLSSAQLHELESALWAAIVALEERSELASRLAERFAARGGAHTAARHAHEAEDALRRANLVREAVANLGHTAEVTDVEEA
jgi:two-component system chemotaxis response regulator CheB